MELIIVLLIGAPIVFVVWTLAGLLSARRSIEELKGRLEAIEIDLTRLKRERAPDLAKEKAEQAARIFKPEPPPVPAPSPTPTPSRPPLIPVAPVVPAPAPAAPPGAPVDLPIAAQISVAPKSAPAAPPPPAVPQPWAPAIPVPEKPAINWEQFMGVKGLAWVGGFALFLGIAFFVKYSFDNNLIPPQLRVAMGFLAGIGLVVGGLALARRNYPALSQTLCATGVVVLYAVTFACRALYHFAFFGPIPTFLLMSLITAAAFLLAARMDALVVAILGMLGGFLTPVLLSTGQDNPAGLFGYVAVLDTGLLLVAMHRRWQFLASLAAAGTILMEAGWALKFFESNKYFEGGKIAVPLVVLAGFNALFLGANALAQKRGKQSPWLPAGQAALAAAALALLCWFLQFPAVAGNPIPVFACIFFVDLLLAALAWRDQRAVPLVSWAGLAVFALLGMWTTQSITPELLPIGLTCYFAFAVFHAGLPEWMRRIANRPRTTAVGLSHIFPPLALLVIMIPIFKLAAVSFLVWPFILVMDLLAIALAVVSLTLLPVLVMLALTLGAVAFLIFKIPADLTGLPEPLILLGAFAVFFIAASVWLARKFVPDAMTRGLKIHGGIETPEAVAAALPACSALLPYLLLLMVLLRLRLPNPTPVFGLCLLLNVMVLGLARVFAMEFLPLAALCGALAVESVWQFWSPEPSSAAFPAVTALGWELLFYAIFTAFPFLFFRAFLKGVWPWTASALAGPAQFLLVYHLVKTAWPNSVMGLLPAAFALPPMAQLAVILKKAPDARPRLTQMAWFGGVALFFITLIFPIQFDRQWITIGWALEGAALLWLFLRVPHPGLRWTGMGLLVAAFCRLALNPDVLDYQARRAAPILNWYLYAYGIVAAALFVSARLLRPPNDHAAGINARGVVAGMGVILSFFLLNIEIADYFSAPGTRLSFDFTSNFARDMTYSIAWALFALGLLIYGIARRVAAARFPAMALLAVTLLKLFVHDLAQLGQLYRIGAFIGVAVVAMLASFAYQRFFSSAPHGKEVHDGPAV